MQLPVLWPISISTKGNWQAKRYCISWDLKKPKLFKNNLNNTRNNVKSRIQNKKNAGIVELLITLNKIIRKYFVVYNYEQLLQNNQCTWCSHLKYGTIFSKKKKLLMRGQKLFWAKKIRRSLFYIGRLINDHIMPRFGRSFINDKCIFQ